MIYPVLDIPTTTGAAHVATALTQRSHKCAEKDDGSHTRLTPQIALTAKVTTAQLVRCVRTRSLVLKRTRSTGSKPRLMSVSKALIRGVLRPLQDDHGQRRSRLLFGRKTARLMSAFVPHEIYALRSALLIIDQINRRPQREFA